MNPQEDISRIPTGTLREVVCGERDLDGAGDIGARVVCGQQRTCAVPVSPATAAVEIVRRPVKFVFELVEAMRTSVEASDIPDSSMANEKLSRALRRRSEVPS